MRERNPRQLQEPDAPGPGNTGDTRNRRVMADGSGSRRRKRSVLFLTSPKDARKVAGREGCRERHDHEDDQPGGDEFVQHRDA